MKLYELLRAGYGVVAVDQAMYPKAPRNDSPSIGITARNSLFQARRSVTVDRPGLEGVQLPIRTQSLTI